MMVHGGVPTMRILGLVALVLVLRGCAGHRGGQAAVQVACAPVTEHQLRAGMRADDLAGAYRLTLVATEGSRAGEAVRGELALIPNAAAMRPMGTGATHRPDATMPLIGTADVDLAQVGATLVGDLASPDPRSPGVALLERHVLRGTDTTQTDLTLRFGSEANRRDVVRFDGAFTALYVHASDAAGFVGTWASGVGAPEAKGYFCAVRTTE